MTSVLCNEQKLESYSFGQIFFIIEKFSTLRLQGSEILKYEFNPFIISKVLFVCIIIFYLLKETLADFFFKFIFAISAILRS